MFYQADEAGGSKGTGPGAADKKKKKPKKNTDDVSCVQPLCSLTTVVCDIIIHYYCGSLITCLFAIGLQDEVGVNKPPEWACPPPSHKKPKVPTERPCERDQSDGHSVSLF